MMLKILLGFFYLLVLVVFCVCDDKVYKPAHEKYV